MTSTVLFSNSLAEQSSNSHHPEHLTDKKRREIKNAFRLAINKSKTHDEALRLTRLRTKFFSPGGLTEDEAIIAFMDVTLLARPGRPGQTPANAKYHVAAA